MTKLALAAAAAMLLAPATALADDLSGTWKISTNANDTDLTITCSFVQKDRSLGGTCQRVGAGEQPAPLTGTVEGQAVTWAYDVQFQGQTLHVAFSGTVEGTTLTGAMNLLDASSKFAAVKQ